MRAMQVAKVRVAVDLSEDEARALHRVLEQYFHFPLRLEFEVDPEILGGVWVRVGDVVVDGSVAGRLEALRHHLRAQARAVVASIELPGRTEVGEEHEVILKAPVEQFPGPATAAAANGDGS